MFSFSEQQQSQQLPKVFRNENGKEIEDLRKNDAKGDFIAIISRAIPDEDKLVVILRRHLKKHRVKVRHFSFPTLAQQYNRIVNLERYSEIWNSTSGRFWFNGEGVSLPAVALSDLGPWRGGTPCTTSTCDTTKIQRIFHVRTQFLASTTQALVDTIKEVTQRPKEVAHTRVGEQQRLFDLLSKFLGSLTAWQGRIENKLTRLTASHVTADKEKHTGTDIDGPQNNTYILLKQESIKIPSLKNVINGYYGAYKEKKGPKNSPMVIKLIT